MTIKTSYGFDVTAADDAAEIVGDYEIFEKLVALDRGDPTVLPELLDVIFGETGKRELTEGLKQEKGRAKTLDVLQVLRETIPKLSENAKK